MKNVVSKLTAKLSRRLALAAGCAFALVSSLSAANYYIAQSALGAGDGSTAANAAPYTFFNAAGNWSSTAGAAGKISPGSTVHLVGTLTSQLNVQGSGTAGNVITVLFEPNAVMTSPAWPQSGAINVVQDNYITIDGGSNGIIQNTANGTNLALQQDSCGVNAPDCHFFTVQNLTVANIYVHVAGADTNSYGSAIQDYGEDTGLVTDFKVTNCKIHDACNAIYCDYGSPGCANYTFSFNTIYNCNWGIGCGDRNSSAVLTNVQVYNNLIYNFSNWDDNNDQNHHNGVYIFAENGGTMKSASIYNNTIGPAFGVHATSAIFFSGASFVGPVLIYNNLFLDNLNDNPDDGFITALPGPGSVFRIYNNDFIGGGVGNALDLGSQHGGTQTFDVRNNIDNGTATFIYVEYGTSVKLTADYNDGYNLASGSQYAYSNDNSGAFDSFAQWQAMGYDLHGTSGNANLNNIFIPQPVSAVIKTGTTMAGDGVTPLSSFFTTDKSGATRPQGSAWDMGAFEYASGSPVLTTQPISQSVTTAGTATFTVAATGTPAPTFEWMKGTVNLTNGGNISGATTAVLTVSSVSASDAATYSAVASNSAGFAISNGAVLTVAGKAPAITSAVAASATSGSSFIYAITATNSPTSFNATGLPSGLSVNTSTGAINGTPTTAGTSVIAISAVNAGGAGTASLTLTVSGSVLPAPVVTSATSATARAGSAFSYAISATNSPTSFNATGLPSGLSVNTSTGVISGTPASAGTFSATISAKNASGTGTASLTLTVSGPVLPAPVVTSATSATARAGSAFSYAISATNSPTSFSATGLPSGLSVNTSTGVISGTPASAGTFSATISARNASGTGSASLTLSINNSVITAPVVTNATSATATVGSAFSFMVTGTNSPTSYGASGLPAGLSLNAASGKISGTPTATGAFAVAVSAKNASGTGSATLTVTVGGVSSAAISVKNAWLGASGSASSAAVAVAPTAGNLVVVAISGYQGSYANHAVTDNKGSVYTRVIGANISTTDLTGSIWYLANAPAGITSIVGSSGSSSLSTTVIVHEVAGATSFTAGEAAATSALGTTNPQTPSITNGTPKSVSFALCANSSGSNPAPISINGSGTIGTWSLLSSTASQETNGGSYIATSVPYLIENSSQAEKQGWTTGTDAYGEHNLVMIAAFH